jgi:hypothetical protein
MNRFRSINARYRQILDCIQRIDEAKVRNHVESFCEIGPRCDELPASIHSTLAYLKGALDQYGYQVQEERADSEYQTNVIAELPGTVSPKCVFEIGAHYDTKPNTPGADDNASGVAGLLDGLWLASNAAKRFDSVFSEWKRQLEAGVEVTWRE